MAADRQDRPEQVPQHRRHRAHRRRQDHDHRTPPLLRRRQAQARRRRCRHHRHRLRPGGAGTRHHHLQRLHPVPVARLHHQPDRHARPRRFHRRGRTLPARPRRLRRRLRRPEGRRGPVGNGLAAGRQVRTCRAWSSSTRWTWSAPTSPTPLDEVRERLEGRPVPLTIPIGSGSLKDSPTPFAGIIDLIEMKALYFDAGRRGQDHPRRADPRGTARRGPDAGASSCSTC